MRKIKINFCDFSKGFNREENDFIDILSERYEVEISDNPDYLFYSVFGKEHTKFQCVKIFYTGECITPDFNEADYAIGFDHITFEDRYLRMPLYRLFQYRRDLDLAYKQRQADNRSGFCSFVCSNDRGMPERVQMLDLLNRYKQVSSGGRYKNNVGGPVADKHEFVSGYKFNIAFENCVGNGYTTEKIVQAFAAGAIPIYYGNPKIAQEFNPDAFINCHEYKSLEAAVDAVIRIDSDDALYGKMRCAPISFSDYRGQNDLKEFLFHIFDQQLAEARRVPRNSLIARKANEDAALRILDKVFLKPKRRLQNLTDRLRHHSI